ncbi:MAG: hypothetical protein WCT26_03495 [Candidatus Buchananbacteria bacterium]
MTEEWSKERDREEDDSEYEVDEDNPIKEDLAEKERKRKIGIWVDRHIKDPPKQGGK